MKTRSGQKIKMTSVEELLGVANEEVATEIELNQIQSFRNHPFKVLDDEKMQDLVNSIRENGILTPVLVRPIDNNKYEMISGHRRMHAAGLLQMNVIPAIIRDMSDEEAVVKMVDSNIQREELLPSEKAFAYKLKMEALSRQGKRTDLTSDQVGRKLETAEIIGQQADESKNQIRRYIRLTNLIPPILDMVDEKRIAFTPAVELSYLLPEEQRMLLSEMEYGDCTPNLSQAQRLKALSIQGLFTKEQLSAIMSEEKANQKERVKIPADRIRKYFPKDYTTAQIEETIVKLCEAYHRKRLRDRDLR